MRTRTKTLYSDKFRPFFGLRFAKVNYVKKFQWDVVSVFYVFALLFFLSACSPDRDKFEEAVQNNGQENVETIGNNKEDLAEIDENISIEEALELCEKVLPKGITCRKVVEENRVSASNIVSLNEAIEIERKKFVKELYDQDLEQIAAANHDDPERQAEILLFRSYLDLVVEANFAYEQMTGKRRPIDLNKVVPEEHKYLLRGVIQKSEITNEALENAPPFHEKEFFKAMLLSSLELTRRKELIDKLTYEHEQVYHKIADEMGKGHQSLVETLGDIWSTVTLSPSHAPDKQNWFSFQYDEFKEWLSGTLSFDFSIGGSTYTARSAPSLNEATHVVQAHIEEQISYLLMEMDEIVKADPRLTILLHQHPFKPEKRMYHFLAEEFAYAHRVIMGNQGFDKSQTDVELFWGLHPGEIILGLETASVRDAVFRKSWKKLVAIANTFHDEAVLNAKIARGKIGWVIRDPMAPYSAPLSYEGYAGSALENYDYFLKHPVLVEHAFRNFPKVMAPMYSKVIEDMENAWDLKYWSGLAFRAFAYSANPALGILMACAAVGEYTYEAAEHNEQIRFGAAAGMTTGSQMDNKILNLRRVAFDASLLMFLEGTFTMTGFKLFYRGKVFSKNLADRMTHISQKVGKHSNPAAGFEQAAAITSSEAISAAAASQAPKPLTTMAQELRQKLLSRVFWREQGQRLVHWDAKKPLPIIDFDKGGILKDVWWGAYNWSASLSSLFTFELLLRQKNPLADDNAILNLSTMAIADFITGFMSEAGKYPLVVVATFIGISLIGSSYLGHKVAAKKVDWDRLRFDYAFGTLSILKAQVFRGWISRWIWRSSRIKGLDVATYETLYKWRARNTKGSLFYLSNMIGNAMYSASTNFAIEEDPKYDANDSRGIASHRHALEVLHRLSLDDKIEFFYDETIKAKLEPYVGATVNL